MKRIIIVLWVCLLSLSMWAQHTQYDTKSNDNSRKYQVFSVAFYNVENLFDPDDDPNTIDEEFTPKGANAWTEDKYRKKLSNLATVISQLDRYKKGDFAGPSVLGMAEIENRRVIEDLINTEPLNRGNYKIVHQDSPDRRGVDVALIYNPNEFELKSYKALPYNKPDMPNYKTRDVLLVNGLMAGEDVYILVNHWPSRYGDKSSALREFAAAICKKAVDSLYALNSNTKIIIMGDLNDDPTDKSTRVVLDAKKEQKDVKPYGLFNTMWGYYEKGIGTLCYQNQWSLFDQIIISYPLLGKSTIDEGNRTLKFYRSEIFNREFLCEKAGRYKGYPLRTFASNMFVNGYSDHFPVVLYLIK